MRSPDLDAIERSYRERGYAIAPGAIDPRDVADAVARLDAIGNGFGSLPAELTGRLVLERNLPAEKRGGIPPEETGDAIFIAGDLPAFDPGFAPLLIHPAVVGPAARLLGTGEIRFHLSNATMKHPGVGSGLSWHRDFPNRYLCPDRASFLRAMVCLDSMDEENGATLFVPGSHILSDDEARNARAAEAAQGSRVEAAVCPPGSIVFIHPKVVHGGKPNRSARHRRNIVVQWGRGDDPVRPSPEVEEAFCDFDPARIAAWLRARPISGRRSGPSACR